MTVVLEHTLTRSGALKRRSERACVLYDAGAEARMYALVHEEFEHGTGTGQKHPEVFQRPTGARLRVVMAGPLPPAIGGMVTVIDDLSKSQLAKDVELVLFDTKKTTPAGRSLLHAVHSRLRLWARWWAALRGETSVAHIHTCSGLTYFLDGSLLFIAGIRGVPALLHIHGGLFEDFLRKLSAPARWLARVIARRAAVVIVLSASWREKLSPLLPGAKLIVIENGIALPGDHATRPPWKIPSILFLGNISIAKGVEDLIEAAARLTVPYRLVLVGADDPEGMTTRLKARAAELCIDRHIVFAGPAYGMDKHQYLREADIFVLPSHAEGLPMSLLEAMASGLAVLSTRVGAIPSVLTHEENGLLVDARDVRGLSAALERLLRDERLRKHLASNAQQLARTHYSVERTAAELMNVYRRVTTC